MVLSGWSETSAEAWQIQLVFKENDYSISESLEGARESEGLEESEKTEGLEELDELGEDESEGASEAVKVNFEGNDRAEWNGKIESMIMADTSFIVVHTTYSDVGFTDGENEKNNIVVYKFLLTDHNEFYYIKNGNTTFGFTGNTEGVFIGYEDLSNKIDSTIIDIFNL